MEILTKRLIKGTLIYSASGLFTQAGAILLLPIFTRLLTPEEYGVLGLLNPLIGFIPMFFVFGIYVAQMRNYVDHKNDKTKLGSYIFSLNIFLFLANITFFIIFISPIGKVLIGKIIDYHKIPFYPFVVLALVIGFIKIFVLMSDNYFRTIHNYSKIAIGNILGFVISSGASIILIYYFKFGVLGRIVGVFLGTIFLFIFFYINYIKNTVIKFNKNYLTESLNIGLPVMLGSITGIILNYSDRFVLSKYLTMDIVGTYSLAYTGGMALSLFISSFNSTWLPLFNELMASERVDKFQTINRRLIQFTTLLVFFCLIGQLFGKEIITCVLPQSYNNTIIYFPYILFGIVFTGINHFFINIFVYYKNTIYLPFFTLFSASLNLGLNIIFIPKYGSLVAAITTIISFAFSSLMLIYIINYKYKNIKFSYLKIIILLIFAMNPFLIILFNMEISILAAVFKIIYLIIFMFIFIKPMGKNLFKLINIKKRKINNEEVFL